ncbi:MAG: signal peptidase II [Acetobacteraceae bacterium]|nr:signal peptidase II [Acetobacteraceae bacterium]
MRALLAGVAGGRAAARAPAALRALRRCRRIGARLRGSRVKSGRLVPLGLFAALLVLVADQASKWWVLDVIDLPRVGQIVLLPVLNLTMVWNRGVTFGLLNGLGGWSSLVIAAVALGVVAALGFWLFRARTLVSAAAIGAIAGGAVGNVIDRLRFGAVVDFIHAHVGEISWYVFNVGDAAIVCGVAALMIESLLPAPALPLRGADPASKEGR